MKTDTKMAIVLASGMNGLGAIRSLKREGIDSIAICDKYDDLASKSNIPTVKYIIDIKLDDYAEKLIRLIGRYKELKPVIIPTSDEFSLFIQRYSEKLRSIARILVPEGEIVSILNDKSQEVKLIKQCGVVIPNTILDITSGTDCIIESKHFPLIVKPKTAKFMNVIGKKNFIISTIKEFENFCIKYEEHLDKFICQEIIPGGGNNSWVCNCCFDKMSNLITSFTFKRLGTIPARYGVTSYAVSKKNKLIENYVHRIGKILNYVGPAMFEFIEDDRDGEYKYIEINPRLGMCNYFDTCCGVNNVYTMYAIATGGIDKLKRKGQIDNVVFLSLFDDFYSRFEDGENIAAIFSRYLRRYSYKHIWGYWDKSDPRPCLNMIYKDGKFCLRSLIKKLK
jgi:predicted ATP-grasp superfamily ATP-dependent carboligase